jgi:hypothetical protein
MNDTKRIWGFVAGIIMIMLVFTTMGFVNQRGGVSMDTKYVKDANRTLWKDIIVNGSTAAGTSTVYNMGSHSYFGFGYKVAWGTTTPHMRIEWFEGVGIDKENIFWEPLPAGTLTASNQASSDTAVTTFRPAVAQWVRFEYEGLTNNATGTTFKAWLTRQ